LQATVEMFIFQQLEDNKYIIKRLSQSIEHYVSLCRFIVISVLASFHKSLKRHHTKYLILIERVATTRDYLYKYKDK